MTDQGLGALVVIYRQGNQGPGTGYMQILSSTAGWAAMQPSYQAPSLENWSSILTASAKLARGTSVCLNMMTTRVLCVRNQR